MVWHIQKFGNMDDVEFILSAQIGSIHCNVLFIYMGYIKPDVEELLNIPYHYRCKQCKVKIMTHDFLNPFKPFLP